jgi:hypothetical protein
VREVVSLSRQREEKKSERGKEVSRDRSGEEKKEGENGKRGVATKMRRSGGERERGERELVKIINGGEKK